MTRTKKAANRYEDALRRHALTYPETHEDFPWGERVIKVKKKVFLFLGSGDGGLGLSVKLPESSTLALMLEFAKPTGYGLGKAGWITAQFGPKQRPPLDLLTEWIDESYRAVAPKKLVARLDEPEVELQKNAARSRKQTSGAKKK